MAYGVTSEGFIIKRLEDIKSDIGDDLKADIQADLDTSDDSLLGQYIGVFSKQFAELWELGSEAYSSKYPESAESVSLDNAVQYNGIERLEASASLIDSAIVFSDAPPVTIPADSKASLTSTLEVFSLDADVNINVSNVAKSIITVLSTPAGATNYFVIINSVGHLAASSATGQENQVAEDLKDSINAGIQPVTAVYVTGTDYVTITADVLTTPHTLAVIDDDTGNLLKLTKIGSRADFTADVIGSTSVPANSLTVIDTPVTGWTEVDNLETGETGRNVETDAELRIRRTESLQVTATGSVEAIRSRILNDVDGVEKVLVFENDTQNYEKISAALTGSISTVAASDAVTGASADFTNELSVDDFITFLYDNGVEGALQVDVIGGANSLTARTDAVYLATLATYYKSNGRPPHSLHIIVEGGAASDIGEKIWDIKPGGIQLFSAQDNYYNVTDSQGGIQRIYFDRPLEKQAWLWMDVTQSTEETIPANQDTLIQDAIKDFGDANFDIGDDFLIQKFFDPIYSVGGVESVDLYIAINELGDSTPSVPSPPVGNDYVQVNISIDDIELLVFDTSRITVNLI